MSENDRTKPEIVEDAPRMRSVQIMRAQQPIVPRAAPIAKHSVSAATQPTHTTKQQQPQELLVTGWPHMKALSPLPVIYVLERTHVTVEEQPLVVADRVAQSLREQSVATRYSKDEVCVEAELDGGVEFNVRLWQGKGGQGVLCEVQKVAGCCYTFCQAAKTVLRAAKGMAEPSVAPKRRTFSIPPCVPRTEQEVAEANTKEGVDLALQLLKAEKQLDTQLLALESLNHISSGSELKSFAARCILSCEIRDTLVSLIGSFSLAEQEEGNASADEVEQQHLTLMRRHALTVLANCLAALESSGELLPLLQQYPELVTRSALQALVNEVAAASERPHEACQAAKCLHSLLNVSDETKRHAADLGALETISQAQRIGVCRHVALENACSKVTTLL